METGKVTIGKKNGNGEKKSRIGRLKSKMVGKGQNLGKQITEL